MHDHLLSTALHNNLAEGNEQGRSVVHCEEFLPRSVLMRVPSEQYVLFIQLRISGFRTIDFDRMSIALNR